MILESCCFLCWLGLDNSDTKELFKHIPELKDIFHIKSQIGEGKLKLYLY